MSQAPIAKYITGCNIRDGYKGYPRIKAWGDRVGKKREDVLRIVMNNLGGLDVNPAGSVEIINIKDFINYTKQILWVYRNQT